MSRPVKKLRWVKLGKFPPDVANGVIYAMEASLDKLGLAHAIGPHNEIDRFVNRAMAKLKMIRALARPGDTAYLIPLGHVAEHRCSPFTYFNEVVPWWFDTWPNLRQRIVQVIRRNRIRTALFTARQSADYFREKCGIDAIWMPEACDPTRYLPQRPLHQRRIDVLELGRKYDLYHDGITSRLQNLGKKHLFEIVKGQLIFKSYDDLREGLADAQISVCFPSSITHPARSGDCETVTLRYFESMASKCLIVGHAPAEFVELMGYNPVVEADMSDPGGQIEQILSNIASYQPVVERNYQAVLQRGIWDVRIQELLAALRQRGYQPQAETD